MKNLKKVLALVMVFALAFTTLASAASVEFTDQKDITKTDAVTMLTSLGIIKGYPSGAFVPQGSVTRAEMAKMIYTIRSGGSDDASAYGSLSTSFNDIGGHWAENYIKYCQSIGIIAGKSSTEFVPNGQVTVSETAKMTLVLMGYDPKKAGLEGTGWDAKTLALCTENNLIENVDTAFTASCPRQDAAQILYNALYAKCVVWSNDKNTFIKDEFTVDNSDGTTSTQYYTVARKWLGLHEYIGTLEGNAKMFNLADGYIRVNGSDSGAGAAVNADFPWSTDMTSFIGEQVKVLYKDVLGGTTNRPDKKDVIYGVYTTGETVTYNTTEGALQEVTGNKVKFDGKEYKTESTIQVYTNYKTTPTVAPISAFQKGGAYYQYCADTIKFVENSNNRIATAYVVEYRISRVTALSADKVTLLGPGSLTREDQVLYDGIAVEDIVNYSALYDTTTYIVTKANVKSAPLSSYESGTKNTVDFDGNTVTVDKHFVNLGTDYVAAISSLKSSDLNETYDFYMIGEYVGGMKKTSKTVETYAYIDSVSGTGSNVSPYQAYMILSDGTKGTYTIDSESKDAAGNKIVANLPSQLTNKLVKYTLNGTKMKVEVVGTDAATATYNKKNYQLNGSVVSTDAVFFVNTSNTDSYNYVVQQNIRTSVGDFATPTLATTDPQNVIYRNADNEVVAAFINNKARLGQLTTTTYYGIVSSNGKVTNTDGNIVTTFTVETNDGTQSVKYDADYSLPSPSPAPPIALGDIVTFDKTSDDYYNTGDVQVISNGATLSDGRTAALVCIKKVDGDSVQYATSGLMGTSGEVTWTGSTSGVTKSDYVTAYVKSADDTGAATAPSTANTAVDSGANVAQNAFLIFKDGNIIAMILDADQDITK